MKQIIEKLRSRHTYLSLTTEEANRIADKLEELSDLKRMVLAPITPSFSELYTEALRRCGLLEDMLAAKDEHISRLETEILMLKSH